MADRSSLLIRPAVVADAAEIARLAGEWGYPSSAQEISARLQQLLTLPSHFIAVAQDAGTLAGWLAAERRLTLGYGERAELAAMVVDTTVRRRGIGKALVQAAEVWAQAQGLAVILVRSNVSRPQSHPFYESLGYLRRKSQHLYAKPLRTP